LKKLVYRLFVMMLILLNAHIAIAYDEMDEHKQHQAKSAEIKKSDLNVVLPKVQMVRQDAKKVQLQDELSDGRVVVLSFIYTTCNAICPMTSQTIAKLQGKLGADIAKVHLVSISIDPEQDTPDRLANYASKFRAGKSWDYYTGVEDASISVQKSLDAYRGDKMNHVPTTYIWSGKGEAWVRVDGFASADDLLREVRLLLGKH
jgi:protein SCO1